MPSPWHPTALAGASWPPCPGGGRRTDPTATRARQPGPSSAGVRRAGVEHVLLVGRLLPEDPVLAEHAHHLHPLHRRVVVVVERGDPLARGLPQVAEVVGA